MMSMLRRLLNREVTVGGVMELALMLALPYLLIGVIVVAVRAEGLSQMQTLYESRDQVLSFGVLVAGWPGVIFADVCMY
jgi:hypothetical protein